MSEKKTYFKDLYNLLKPSLSENIKNEFVEMEEAMTADRPTE